MVDQGRDEELGSVARAKAAMPGIGHPIFLPNERVERREIWPVRILSSIGHENEDLYLLWTTAENALGARKNGRTLISAGPSAGYLYGGAFWIEERRKRCVQSIWVEPEYRHGARHIVSGQPTIVDRSGTHPVDLADLLGKMLRKARVVCALEPMSTAGLRWVKRQGFAIVK